MGSKDEGGEELQRIDRFVRGEMSDYNLLPKQEATPRVFRYEKPDTGGRPRVFKKLGLTDILFAGVQVCRPGAANVMHSHSGMDGFYLVLKGRMRFYGEGDVVLGDFGPMEGVVMPRNTPYWMEVVGDEEVELLHIEAFDRRVANRKTVYGKDAPRLQIPAV
jgi:gentisate 1,2-dioxygenase